jgi:YidC/Oxa1 family membrane protein insertase
MIDMIEMTDILYTIFIFPLETVIELIYLVFRRIFRNPSIALLGVSAAVSVLTLPLYFMAERYQAAERMVQKAMLPEIQNIKAIFKGDERYLMLAAWYRRNNYHPLYALRSSLGVVIQIPFFIAAYHFIANLEQLKNISFLFIKDLSLPDTVFRTDSLTINILPVMMTVLNVVAGAVYTKGFLVKDKIQLYAMAAVFLVLLYNSPAGLALYWTCNNIFSLVKNILQKTKYPKKIIYIVSCVIAVFTLVYVLFIHRGALHKRILLAVIMSAVFLVPRFIKYATSIKQRIRFPRNYAATDTKTFILSAAALFLLAGLVTPSTVIASSVEEFSFLAPYTSPLPFLARTLTQSAGIFLFWPLCLYAIFSKSVKIALNTCLTVFCYLAAVNTFFFQGYYGFLTPDLHFSSSVRSSVLLTLINIAAMPVCAGIIIFLLYTPKKYLIAVLQNITLITFLVLGGVHIYNITREFSRLNTPEAQIETQNAGYDSLEKVYTLSKTGQNVLVIMLDRGISGFVPYIFAEKPELMPSFSGFIYYPNTISFGGHTLMGAPGLFGGYEYAPLEIQKNDTMPLAEKYDEAMMVLPKLFSENGFQATVSNQPLMNPGLYDSEQGIVKKNITGQYTDYYLARHPDLDLKYFSPVLETSFIRFSFFKLAPLIIRNFVYDNGDYLLPDPVHLITTTTMNNYAALDVLPEITAVAADNQNRFIILNNELTHDAAFLEAPSYEPVTVVTNKGSGPCAMVESYHANMAAFLLLGKWFDFLKENGVYDNTRIIIVSDHGFDVATRLKDDVKLPNREMLEIYQAMLLVKDFNAQTTAQIPDELPSDHSFMTNADVPVLVTKELIPDPVNPYTGKEIRSEKENGVTITTSHLWQARKQLKYTYNIKPNEWLYVHDDIFKPENWSRTRQFF